MENSEIKVLRSLRDWRASGYRALLATVVKTWGSSPRPIGSMIALRDNGDIVGSVSGGCIEEDLIYRYTEIGFPQISSITPQLVKYGLSADEAHRFGLPCGGTLELLLEFNPELEALNDIVQRLESGMLVRRTVSCSDGHVKVEPDDTEQSLHFDGNNLSYPLGPRYRMLLIGAGMLAEYLSSMALMNGFEVTVCDPRIEHLNSWSVAGVQKTAEMPDDAVITFKPDKRTCIVALSHDPKLDDLALLEALNSSAFYVGAIGSHRNSANRRNRMITHFSLTEQSLARLHSPVGIYIASKTPAEIAVSAMAEIIAMKNFVLQNKKESQGISILNEI